MVTWQLVVIYFFVSWAVVTDIWKREISNFLVGNLFLIGILTNVFAGTWLFMIVSVMIATIIALILFKIGMYGGGDLKLLIALASFVGLGWVFGVFFYSLIIALPLFAFYMLKDRTWKPCTPYAVAILGGVIWQNLSPLI